MALPKKMIAPSWTSSLRDSTWVLPMLCRYQATASN